jgi:hypothetical protein
MTAEEMREAAANLAHSFTLESNRGDNRLMVPASWAEMSPSDVYNIGADDAAFYIGEDIRAIPLPESEPDPRDDAAIDGILERHQGAMTKTDYEAAGDDIRRLLATRDATIARLSAELATVTDALRHIMAHDDGRGAIHVSVDVAHIVRAALAKLSEKGA